MTQSIRINMTAPIVTLQAAIFSLGILFTAAAIFGKEPVPSPFPLRTPAELEESVKACSSAEAIHKVFRSYFAEASDDELYALRFHSHHGIALQAGWEHVRRRTIGSATSMKAHRVPVDASQVQRFIGFVEGRLGFPLPPWWKSGLKESLIYVQDRVVVPFGERLPDEKPNPFVHLNERYWVLRGMTFVEQIEPKFQLLGEHQRYVIPAAIIIAAKRIDDWDGHLYLTAADTDSGYVFAAHGPDPQPYEIYIIDDREQRVVWKAAVWTENRLVRGGSGPVATHWSTLISHREQVHVVGCCSHSLYIEAFSLADGKNLFRFSTSY